MTKIKKIPAMLIAVLMAFTMIPVSASAASADPIDLSEAMIDTPYDEGEIYNESEGWDPPDVVLYGDSLFNDAGDFDYVVLDEDDSEIPEYRAGTFRYKITGTGDYTGTAMSDWFTISKAPQKVKLRQTSYTKFYGDKKFSLKPAIIYGNGKLKYKSSNTKALTVSSTGVVTIKKVKKLKKVKISVYVAATINYKKSPVKTATVEVYPKQKTTKAYKKYIGKWREDDFNLYVKVMNKNYLHAVLKTKSGDSVTIKKLMNVKKKHKFKLKSKKGKDVTLYLKMKMSKPYKLPNGIRMKEGPEFWCTGDSKAWRNGSYLLGKKKLYLTTYRILK